MNEYQNLVDIHNKLAEIRNRIPNTALIRTDKVQMLISIGMEMIEQEITWGHKDGHWEMNLQDLH